MGTAFDAWYPGYIDYAPIFKNIAAFWTETALYQYATPHDYTHQRLSRRTCATCGRRASTRARGRRAGGGCATRWTTWKRRRSAVLEYASKYKDSLLFNRYQAGRDQIALGAKKAPYAYVVPQEQRDPVAAVELLRRLAFGGVRVSQLTDAVTIDGDVVPGRHVGHPDRSGIRRDGARGARRAALSGSAAVSRRTAGASVRRRRLDAAAADGRDGRRRDDAAERRDARAKMKLLGPAPDLEGEADAVRRASTADAAPFDSVPGAGFDTDPAAAAIVPPAGRITGSGSVLVARPGAEQHLRAINRAWKQGAHGAVLGETAATSSRGLSSTRSRTSS